MFVKQSNPKDWKKKKRRVTHHRYFPSQSAFKPVQAELKCPVSHVATWLQRCLKSFHLNSYISVCFLVDSSIKYSVPQYPLSKIKWEREPFYETPADFLNLMDVGSSSSGSPVTLGHRFCSLVYTGEDVICPPSWCCPWTTVAQKLLAFVCCYAFPYPAVLLTFNTRFQSIHTIVWREILDSIFTSCSCFYVYSG